MGISPESSLLLPDLPLTFADFSVFGKGKAGINDFGSAAYESWMSPKTTELLVLQNNLTVNLWYDIWYHMKIVLDTNVIFTGLRSRKGTSFRLLSLLPSKKFSIVISVPLIIEYESVLMRGKLPASISEKDIGDVIDFLCHIGSKQDIFFLWRPCLPDPSDDLVLEVAVAGDCDAIITYNKKHFKHAMKFGLNVYDPKEFLIKIGVLK